VVAALQATPSELPPSIDSWFVSTWPDLLKALLVVLLTAIVLRVALDWTVRAMRRARVDTGTQILVRRSLAVVIVITGLLSVLGTLGIPPAALVTVAGAVGLAFSLALQDILKNFFSGVYLLLERPFRVGDLIKVKEQEGRVENIGVRTTTLRTPENVQILVPNAVVFAEVVSNRSQAEPGPGVPVAHGDGEHPQSV
jgi:small-conductance mechanosensitive channel